MPFCKLPGFVFYKQARYSDSNLTEPASRALAIHRGGHGRFY